MAQAIQKKGASAGTKSGNIPSSSSQPSAPAKQPKGRTARKSTGGQGPRKTGRGDDGEPGARRESPSILSWGYLQFFSEQENQAKERPNERRRAFAQERWLYAKSESISGAPTF
jgi:hypothetical protein